MAKRGRKRTIKCDNPYCPPELLDASHEWHYNMPMTHYECLRCGWTASYDPILKHFLRKTSTRDGIHPDGYEGMSLEELNEYVELYESQIKEFNEEESDTAGKGKYRNLNKNDMRKPRR